MRNWDSLFALSRLFSQDFSVAVSPFVIIITNLNGSFLYINMWLKALHILTQAPSPRPFSHTLQGMGSLLKDTGCKLGTKLSSESTSQNTPFCQCRWWWSGIRPGGSTLSGTGCWRSPFEDSQTACSRDRRWLTERREEKPRGGVTGEQPRAGFRVIFQANVRHTRKKKNKKNKMWNVRLINIQTEPEHTRHYFSRFDFPDWLSFFFFNYQQR